MARIPEKTKAVSVGIETLRDDLQQLTDDFKEVMSYLGEKSSESVKEGTSALMAACESARSSARGVYERIRNQGKDVVEKSRTKISSKPITYFVSALAAGVLAGALIRRRRRMA